MSILSWFKKERQWHRDHEAAFSAVTRKQEDGLTLFQHQCLSAIEDFLPLTDFQQVPMEKEDGSYLIGKIGKMNDELYLYPNEAAIFGKKNAWFEEWDYLTPTELINALTRECENRVT